jgi:hypothetical protein
MVRSEPTEYRSYAVGRATSGKSLELSPNFGDGLKDQAAAWA